MAEVPATIAQNSKRARPVSRNAGVRAHENGHKDMTLLEARSVVWH